MRQIPLDLSIATDGTTLPSRNHLLSAQRAITAVLVLQQKEYKDASNEPEFYLPDADMFKVA